MSVFSYIFIAIPLRFGGDSTPANAQPISEPVAVNDDSNALPNHQSVSPHGLRIPMGTDADAIQNNKQ